MNDDEKDLRPHERTPDDLPEGYMEAVRDTNWWRITPLEQHLTKYLEVHDFEDRDVDFTPQLRNHVPSDLVHKWNETRDHCGDRITWRQVSNRVRSNVRKKPVPDTAHKEEEDRAFKEEIRHLKRMAHQKDEELGVEKRKVEHMAEAIDRLRSDKKELEKENTNLKQRIASLGAKAHEEEMGRAHTGDAEMMDDAPPKNDLPPPIPGHDTGNVDDVDLLLGNVKERIYHYTHKEPNSWAVDNWRAVERLILNDNLALTPGMTRKIRFMAGRKNNPNHALWKELREFFCL